MDHLLFRQTISAMQTFFLSSQVFFFCYPSLCAALCSEMSAKDLKTKITEPDGFLPSWPIYILPWKCRTDPIGGFDAIWFAFVYKKKGRQPLVD